MDKQILNITANEQILTVDEPIRISTNKVNYIEARFDLGTNWSGYDSVRAVWFNDFYCISTVLDANGVAFVPSEVMKRNGFVKVNLVGSISEDDVLTDRLTSYPIVAVIVDCTAQINGAETSPITPSQFEQYVAIVRALVDSVKDIDHIELNDDYTLTIYYSDGTSYTTTSIRGEQGADGNGIQSITKTGTSGLVDTYTITFTDGQTTTFTVTNGAKGDTGNGIQNIAKTSTVGLVDTYTITYTNGTTTTFTVTNGEKGEKGDTGEVSLSELEQATVVQTLSDTEPYNFRRTNNGNGAGHREYDEIVGASVGWNQLVDSGTTSVTIPNGHKYYSNINNTKTIGSSNGSAISINDGTKDNVIDLTQMLGSTIADYVYTLEQSTAGSGVTWLKQHFPKLFDNGYQPYDSGSIKSVSGLTAHEMVGKNVFDDEVENGGYSTAGKIWGDPNFRNKNLVKVIEGQTYYFRIPNIQSLYVFGYSDENYSDGVNLGSTNFETTIPQGVHYIGFFFGKSQYGNTYKNDICINLSDTSINGQYEPYEKHTYTLDPSVTLRGRYVLDGNKLKAAGDVWSSDGEIARKYGTRAYQSGDESDATVVTDGTTTVYPLTTPTTETATPYESPQWCDSRGTEEYVGSELPVGHNTDYPMTMVDCADGLGNGTYEARLTIANGVKTFTWQSV